MREFLERVNTAEPWHNQRYLLTLERVRGELARARRVLDLGGRSPFTALLEEFWPHLSVVCEPFDLRQPFPLPDQGFDVVFCLEVLEHLKDRETDELATFCFGGMRNCLRESLRVLRPGGLLVVSTPNVCSYRSLRNVLEGRHPFQFLPHLRELAPAEVHELLREAGFKPVEVTTIDAWSNGGSSLLKLKLLLFLFGYSRAEREDCILALARRPGGNSPPIP